MVARWSDSTYFLYGSKDYLVAHLPIRTHADSMTICSVRNCGFWMKNCDQPKLHFCSASMRAHREMALAGVGQAAVLAPYINVSYFFKNK